MKKCIFHLPYKVNVNRPSGPNVRPSRLIAAFENIGYDVTVISGYSDERSRLIRSVRSSIESGEKYDFVYSEASTMPTALTDKDHLPRRLDMDFDFFTFCKTYEIPIGLFYRDVYWSYPEYDNSVSKPKAILAKYFYKRDLKKYNQLIDILYVPNRGYLERIGDRVKCRVEELPPAIIENSISTETSKIDSKSSIKILYVGGVNEMYDISEIVDVVADNLTLELIIATREDDWNSHKNLYPKAQNSKNISVIHVSGDELVKYYGWANIVSLAIKPNEYRKMAVPIKLFEYIGHQKPIIAYSGTYTGKYVEEKNIGFSIKHGTGELEKLLLSLPNRHKELEKIVENLSIESKLNFWENRARKVASQLTEKRKKKVLILSDASNSHTRKWVSETREEGYEVVVVSLNEGQIKGTKVYSFAENNQQKRSLLNKMKYLTHVFELKRIIDSENPEIVHAHYASSYGLLAYLSGEKYYLNVWGKDVYEFPKINFITKTLLKIVLNNSIQVYSTSNVMRSVTQQYTKRKIIVTPFGVDTSIFYPNPIETEEFIYGYIKLIETKYGVSDLVSCFNKVMELNPNQKFKLIIIGKGTLKQSLIEKVDQLGISNSVEFIDYINGPEEVAKYYNTFDVAVFPSIDDSESFGVSAVESMACGTPTIVSDVSGFREITEDGKYALMFNRGNKQELLELMHMLYISSELRSQLGEKSHNHIKEMYDVKENFLPVFNKYKGD